METLRDFYLKRISSYRDGTFGVLLDGHVPFALTLEPPWVDNQPYKSCIPNGEYLCKRINSPKFGDTFEITDVTGRTHIVFHKGNYGRYSLHQTSDTQGCVLVGEQFAAFTPHKAALAASRAGFLEFMDRLKDTDEFNLTISGDLK